MKLISFDIGIKNMAYCIFDVSLQNTTLTVQDWNILNLMDIENTIITRTCSCHLAVKMSKKKMKNGPIIPIICGKKAKYEKNGETFCETHAKKCGSMIIPEKNILPAALKKLSRDEMIHLGTITYAVFVDPENIPKTKKACLDCLLVFFQEKCFTPILVKKTKGAGEIDLITIGRNMRDRLNELVGVSDITHVIMENQISPLAGRMKTIQGMLTQYYIMQEKQLFTNSDQSYQSYKPYQPYQSYQPYQIEYISSANKLKDLVEPIDKTATSTTTVQEKYKKHKTDSIIICKRFLEENQEISSWTPSFEQSSKRDDLADCFLQGIWYLKKEKIITYADNLKINIV